MGKKLSHHLMPRGIFRLTSKLHCRKISAAIHRLYAEACRKDYLFSYIALVHPPNPLPLPIMIRPEL